MPLASNTCDFSGKMAVCEIIVGTYEELVIGHHLIKNKEKYELVQSFSNHSHTGSVRCVSASKTFLASGSTDEIVHIFNIKKRTECGSLVHHEGTINCMKFYGENHLFTCSDDGTICIWNTNNWQCLKTLLGHKEAVTFISIHPSGKIALSLSRDRSLRTWNLIKGRSAYVTNLKTVADIVEWSPSGRLYAVVIRKKVDVYSCELAGIVHTIDFGQNISAILFLENDWLVISGDGGNVEIHSIQEKCLKSCFEAHSARIKSLSSMPMSSENTKFHFLVTASSDGIIKIWKLNIDELDKSPELLTEKDTGCRINCATVAILPKITNNKIDSNTEIKNDVKATNSETHSKRRKVKQNATKKKRKIV